MRGGIGGRLTALGERWDAPWLVENPIVFRYYHRLARENAPAVVSAFEEVFPSARSYFDVGSGSGAYAAQAQRRGLDVVACEYSPFGRLWARAQRVDCRRLDLASPRPVKLDREFDVAYSFEVAQQVDESLGHRLVELLARSGRSVVFSSAQPGQGGLGRLNLQPKQYWIESFERSGMRYLPDESERLAASLERQGASAYWLRDNLIALRSAGSGAR